MLDITLEKKIAFISNFFNLLRIYKNFDFYERVKFEMICIFNFAKRDKFLYKPLN